MPAVCVVDDLLAPPHRLVLPNGLVVRLIHLPWAARAAAVARVHAGSHDEPPEYPGLAHFLEHLVFLGSADYPPVDGLLPFVQRCAGQVNACTRERHTDYFFEVPAAALEEGLRRLLDMLARPLLEPAAQAREREVLHAEFMARAEDAETLRDAAFGTAVAPGHPFAAFHAGSRETLPLEQNAFQQALLGFQRRFYHAGQIDLVVAGPQPIAELAAMAAGCGLRLAAGTRLPPSAVPDLLPLAAQGLQLQVRGGRPHLGLGFVLQGLPAGVDDALDLLSTWLGAEVGGGLLRRLRDAGWCDGLTLRLPYRYLDQGLLTLEFALTTEGLKARGAIIQALFDWLAFFAKQAPWREWRAEHGLIKARQLACLEPLARARYWLEPQAWSPQTDTADLAVDALRALLEQLNRRQLLCLTCDTQERALLGAAGFPLRLSVGPLPASAPQAWSWHKPAMNPWLRSLAASAEEPLACPALRWSSEVSDGSGLGALFLRWRFPAGLPPAGLGQVLDAALRPSMQAARQAGVELRFEEQGGQWRLGLFGLASVQPAVLAGVIEVLRAPPYAAWPAGRRLFEEECRELGGELLIRQLLRRLPQLLGGRPGSPAGRPELSPALLAECWRDARWDALAFGMPTALVGAVQRALARAPGQPADYLGQAQPQGGAYLWWNAALPASESAVLLFCPMPARDARTEAAWRVLAQLYEGHFYRRLRTELQLGYAVFCGFRQLGEQAGLLFAVQSPRASAAEILGHIEGFLAERTVELEALSARRLEQECASLGTRLGDPCAGLRNLAEQAWQAQLAGCGADYPLRVRAALQSLSLHELCCQQQALQEAWGGWRVLANAGPPDRRWQAL